jgi:hypothetical protein
MWQPASSGKRVRATSATAQPALFRLRPGACTELCLSLAGFRTHAWPRAKRQMSANQGSGSFQKLPQHEHQATRTSDGRATRSPPHRQEDSEAFAMTYSNSNLPAGEPSIGLRFQISRPNVFQQALNQ